MLELLQLPVLACLLVASLAVAADSGANDPATDEKLLAVADKKVAPEEADAYFDRAQKFAAANPDKQFLIAIRYFEVAERFVGSEISIKAQKLSLEAQEAHMRSLDSAKEKRRDTL